MPLITRTGKGSKLTIQEMDGNLTYLENLGLNGKQYVFVSANGTPEENGLELQEAYIKAGTMSPANDNKITVIIAPGKYKMTETLVLDNDYIDLVSLTGEPGVELDLTENNFYTGTVDFSALGGPTFNVTNDPFIINDIGTFDFNTNPALSIEADCTIVGIKTATHESDTAQTLGLIQYSSSSALPYIQNVGNTYILPINQITAVSPIVKNVIGGFYSFGFDVTVSLNTTINGQYENCYFYAGSFLGVNVNAIINNCQGYLALSNSQYSGRFSNIVLDSGGFGGYDLTGQFVNCAITDSLATGEVSGFSPSGGDGDLYGYFENCKVQGEGFASYSNTVISSTAYLKNCEVYSDVDSFGLDGIEDGAILENCVGGLNSFCENGAMEGKLIKCRKTSGTFAAPTGNGKQILCIDGTDAVITLP
jgi:hypothetical protein